MFCVVTNHSKAADLHFYNFQVLRLLSEFRADNKNVTPTYLYQWLQTKIAKSDLEGRTTGTTVVGIKQVELKKVNVLTPNNNLPKIFEEIAFPLLRALYKKEDENITLGQLRDELLPKLLSGQLYL